MCRDKLTREGVKIRILGRRAGLPPDVAEIVERAEARTAHNDKFFLQVAFNYGGRADIVTVVTAVAESEAAIETLVAMRDRVIAAYEEIMRMPV